MLMDLHEKENLRSIIVPDTGPAITTEKYQKWEEKHFFSLEFIILEHAFSLSLADRKLARVQFSTRVTFVGDPHFFIFIFTFQVPEFFLYMNQEISNQHTSTIVGLTSS